MTASFYNNTAVSTVDDYTLSRVSPQPVLAVYATVAAPAPVEAVAEVVADEAEVETPEAKAAPKKKVVQAPAVEAVAVATEGVETK